MPHVSLIQEVVALRRTVIGWVATGARVSRAGFLVPICFFSSLPEPRTSEVIFSVDELYVS